MTTRFKEDDLTEGLTGAIHETGHALYEQGRNLDEEWKDLPVNVALSMGIHESQSLLWERMIALGKPFQHYLLPRIRQHFPSFPAEATPELLYEAQNTLRERERLNRIPEFFSRRVARGHEPVSEPLIALQQAGKRARSHGMR